MRGYDKMMIDTDSPEFADAVMAVLKSRLSVAVTVLEETHSCAGKVEVALEDTAIELNYYCDTQEFASDFSYLPLKECHGQD